MNRECLIAFTPGLAAVIACLRIKPALDRIAAALPGAPGLPLRIER